jgi:hypothetical protein
MATNQQGTFIPKKLDVKVVHGDLSQEVVSITVDKLSLILHKHADGLGKSRDWVAPFGLLLSLILTFVTTDFKDWVLSADTWRAIFVLLGIGSALWLLRTFYDLFTADSVEDLVEKIKR